MAIRHLLSLSWHTLWQNKYLPALGVVVAIAGGSIDIDISGLVFRLIKPDKVQPGGVAAALPAKLAHSLGSTPAALGATGDVPGPASLVAGAATLALLLVLALLAAIAIRVISRVAAGSLIAWVGHTGQPKAVPLRQALHTGWRRAWQMLITLSLPLVPLMMGVALSLLLADLYLYRLFAIGAVRDLPGAFEALRTGTSLHTGLVVLNLPFALGSLALAFIQPAADRACVLENRRAVEAFRRGWQVVRPHFGAAATLLLLQLTVGLAASLLLHLPNAAPPIVYLLRLVTWGIEGVLIAFFSTLWTLAWGVWSTMPAPSSKRAAFDARPGMEYAR